MAQETEPAESREIGPNTGRDPVLIAAIGSVLLAWYQYYVRGNTEHGLFIGLWPPTLLAFSNAIRLREISESLDRDSTNIVERVLQNR